jgi:two-component system, NtrC family, nitrogen regulation sensor histidine kinase GlnL
LVSGNPQGHGLGLTLAQNIVHQHGGIIECQTGLHGTTFEICLPVGEPQGRRA